MPCPQTFELKGLALNCDANLGGIVKAWFAPAGQFVPTVSASTHTCTIARAEGVTSGTTMKLYEFNKETGSLVSTQVVNEQNGSNYYQNLINLVFNRMEGWKHFEINSLAQSELDAVILDSNGNKWWVPGVKSIGSEIATTGTATDDRNGYTLALQANSPNLPYEVSMTDEAFAGIADQVVPASN